MADLSGNAAAMRVLELPEAMSPKGNDVSDWLDVAGLDQDVALGAHLAAATR